MCVVLFEGISHQSLLNISLFFCTVWLDDSRSDLLLVHLRIDLFICYSSVEAGSCIVCECVRASKTNRIQKEKKEGER